MSARDRAGDLYCSFFEDAEDAIAVGRVSDRRLLHVNPAFCRLLGRSYDEMVGEPFDTLHPADEVERVRAAFVEQAESARNVAAFVPCLRGDGSVLRCDIVMQLLRTPAGALAVGTFSPSAERTPVLQTTFDTEERLKRLGSEFRQLLHCLPMALAVLDETGAIELVNERFLELFGYSRAEVPDLETWWRRAYPEPRYRERVRQIWESAVREAAATGVDIRVDQEARITCKDGTVRQVEVIGRRVGLRQVLVLRDHTQRRAAERALRESEAQLRHAHKMEAVGRLAGSVAHDFNNLLTGIVGNIAILERQVDDAELRALCQEVEVGSKRAAELVRQLLSFSRKDLLAPQPLDVDELVRGVSRVIEKLLGEEVRLRLVRAPRLPAVLGDRGQLEQVLVNLAINARDAMPDGGELLIESSFLAGEGVGEDDPGQVCLTVRDQGCGMSEAVRARIFEPFFTTKGARQGVGARAVDRLRHRRAPRRPRRGQLRARARHDLSRAVAGAQRAAGRRR